MQPCLYRCSTYQKFKPITCRMESFLEFFETMPSWQKLLWIVICLSLNWMGEAVKPLFKFDYAKLKHVGTNLVFLAVDLAINVLFGIATIGIMLWLSANQIGLLYWVDLPLVIELLIGVMICLLYTSPSPRDLSTSRMPSSA